MGTLWMVLVMFIVMLSIWSSSHGQNTDGFISIDCGLQEDSNYTDSGTGIIYSPDAPYIAAGENRVYSPEQNLTGYKRYYKTVRSFPTGKRNCYTLAPLVKNRKYLVRAEFWYLNYDGLNTPPTFDVYLGVHFWQTVPPQDFSRLEIIAVSPGESMQVCLVNKGLGTPYITVLELRPLLDTMYPMANVSQALVLLPERLDHGGNGSTRFPKDPYDRIWFGRIGENQQPITTNNNISDNPDYFRAPESVLRSAVTPASTTESLNINVSGSPGEKIFWVMYFIELQLLQVNETREFNLYANDSLLYSNYRPAYLEYGFLYTSKPQDGNRTTYSLKATGNSTLPPIINAFEAHKIVQLDAISTLQNDTTTLMKIRDLYKLKKDWAGDPCEPQNLTWEGVNCSKNDGLNHRIVALNLSHAQLAGGISPSFSNLSALKSLDLSFNNLTGEIPESLGTLPKLQTLNLANNQLNLTIPESLNQKVRSGTLVLSMDGNTKTCNATVRCEGTESKKNTLPLILGISVPVLVILLISIFVWIWITKRRRQGTVQSSQQAPDTNADTSREKTNSKEQMDYSLESSQLSFSDIVNITRNFECAVGRGASATVYYGRLPDKTEVAVKMLTKSTQGTKGFHAEAQILTRVHHKNLVSLLGYCDDKNNLALVYEYMQKGSIAEHLSGDRHDSVQLNWQTRLQIALDVAQGLEYLHMFCKPPVVHRDVKSRNILLNEKLEAKLGDFGLSRLFGEGGATNFSTVVAGTPGYLDPEYCITGKLNEKSDIYSFGIVLLEIITGKVQIGKGPQHSTALMWVQSSLEKGDVSSIADRQLQGDYDLNSMWKAVEIAMACLSPSSDTRPKMSEVVKNLKECLEFVISRGTSASLSVQMSTASIDPTGFDSFTRPSAR